MLTQESGGEREIFAVVPLKRENSRGRRGIKPMLLKPKKLCVNKSAHGGRQDSEILYEATVFNAIPDYSMKHMTCVSSPSSISTLPFPGVY